jgi:hypothetical protein
VGNLIYGTAPAINIDDWALMHLRAVMVTKLRRDESFSFSWNNEKNVHGDDALNKPGLYGTVWVSKSSSLYFSFDAPTDAALSRAWLMALVETANSSTGLHLVPEPEVS